MSKYEHARAGFVPLDPLLRLPRALARRDRAIQKNPTPAESLYTEMASRQADVRPARDPGMDGNRREMFDVLRLVAAGLVIFSHSFLIADFAEPLPLRWPGVDTTFGMLGVEIFFVLSGYWVVSSWLQSRKVRQFLVKRVSRIFPGFLVALFLTTFVLGPLVTSLPASEYLTEPRTIKHFVYNSPIVHVVKPLGTLPGVFLDNPRIGKVNGSLWSLPLELAAYAAVLAFGITSLLRRKWPALVALAALAMGYTSLGYVARDVRETNGAILWMPREPLVALLAFFFCGAALYLYRDKIPMRWSGFAVAAGALGISLVAGVAVLGMAALSYMVIFLGTRRAPGARRITRFGDPSYGAYLYAYPVQQTLYQLGVRDVLPMFVLASVISFGLGYASWHAVERPALRLGRRLLGRRSPVAAPEPVALPEPALATD